MREGCSAWWPQFAREPAHGIGLHGIDGHGNLIGPFAGGELERPLFEPARSGRNSRQRHPVFAHRTHWPIADCIAHNLTPGSQAADLLFFNYVTSGSVFKRLLGRLERPAREPVDPAAAMKCVACAAPPKAPIPPTAGLRTRPLEEWALIAAPGRPDCRKPVGRLAVAGQRQVERSDRWTGVRDKLWWRVVSRGACREFSDCDFEGLGGPSGWARVRCRTDALRKHPDLKRIGLDRPDAAVGRARTKARDLCRCIRAAGRPRLAHHGFGSPVPGFSGSVEPSLRRRAGATVWTQRGGCYRTEPGPADASTGCRQHAHLVRMKHGGLRDRHCDQVVQMGGEGCS
jgi:hypothetical protein